MALRSAYPSRQRLEVVAARKTRSAKQVAVSRTLVAKKGHEATVAGLAGEILNWTKEESSVPGKKGIVEFGVVRDDWEPNTFHFWERYETVSAFGAHTTAPRMMELMAKLQPFLESPVGVALYSYENGRLGPAAMHAGPKGEGGLDDATGASGAAGGASYKQTSRAFDLTKINEHEEAERERLLMATMGLESGGARRPADSASAAGTAGEQDTQAGGSSRAGSEAARGTRWPPLLGLVVSLKDRVMGPLCRMMGHGGET